jgi:hypothetical protein
MPENFSIVASNDDSNWTVIKSVTGQAWTSADYVNFVVNADVAYKYYAIVAQLTNTNYAYIGEWRLFTETFTVDAGVVSTTAASGLDVGYTEHPVEPMTDYHTYVEGHGTYEASASSYATAQASPEPWRAFDNNFVSGAWRTTGFSNSTYLYTGPDVFVDVGGTRYNGPSLTIKMPYAIVLSHSTFSVWETTYGFNTSPKVGYIFGSNDGVDWYKIFYTSDFGFEDVEGGNIKTVSINATTSYTHYAFVCTEKNNTGTETAMNLNEWRLFAEKPVTRMENVHISGELSSETLQTGYIKWPKVPLKANESEGYVATRSSRAYANYEAWKAFNENANPSDDAWIGGLTNYTTGGYPITTSGAPEMNGVYGDWLGIELPQSIKVSYIQLLNRNYSESGRLPTSGRFYGSKDNITFTELTAWSNISISPGYEPTRIDVNSNDTYKTYRIQVERLYYGGTGSCAIGELQLFEAATGVGAAPTSAKLQVAGSLGMAKGAEFFAGDDVVMELPKTARLMSFPKDALTGYTTPSGYVVSQPSDTMWDSSVPTNNRNAWALFDKTFVEKTGEAAPHFTVSGSSDRNYNSSGEYTGSNSLGGISGDWVSIKLPHKIQVQSVNYWRRYATTRQVLDATVLGSTDGTNWTSVGSWRNADFSSIVTNFPMNTSKYYDHLACVFERINGTVGYVNFHELEFLGYQEYDDEATGVDVVHRSIPNKPGQQHLEVYWDANDSNSYSFADSSNVYDLSGNGRTGTLTNNVTFDSTDNGWITTSTTTSGITGSFAVSGGDWVHSVSYWVKVRALPPSSVDYLFGFASAVAYNSIAHYIKPDGTLVTGSWTLDYPTSNFTIPVGEWFHVTTTYKGGGFSPNVNAKTYINGELKNMGTNISSGTDGTALGIPTTAQVVYVGYGYGGAATSPEATYGNFRMYSNKALNADQVRELYEYDAERFGHRQNLVALHKGCLGVGVAHPTSRFEVAGADGLQEFPPKAMTDFETYMEGHGVFRASASTFASSSYQTHYAFDYNTSTAWLSLPVYDGTDGSYLGSVVTGNVDGSGTLTGEWIQIELPHKTFISRSTWLPNTITRGPKTGSIIGSNDGSTWYTITSFSGKTYASSVETELLNATASTAYKYFRIVGTTIDSGARLEGKSWRLFGTPAPSSLEDGHLTLGKALTLPRVSGHPAGAETPRAASLVVHYDTTVDSVVSGSTVVDISGSGNNGTLTGGGTYESLDRAFKFDGNVERITANPTLGTGDQTFSVSFWAKRTGTAYNGTVHGVVYVGTNDAAGYGIGMDLYDNSAMYWFVHNGKYLLWNNSSVSGGAYTTFPLNEWVHVVCTHESGTWTASNNKVYINGVHKSDPTVGGSTELNFQTSNPELRIGDARNNPFTGQISNFKIWDVALTAEEVAAEYALGRTGKSINLTDTSLCLGGTVPRAQLDVRGMALINNREYGLSGVTYDRGSWSGGTSVELGRMQPDLYNYHRIVVRFGGIASVTQRFNARIRARHTGSSSFETSGYESISSMIKKNDNTSLTNLYNGSDGPLVNYYSDGGATGGQDNLLIIDVSSKRENRAQVQFTCSWTYGNIGYSQSFGGFHRSGASYDKIKLYLEDFDVNNVITSSSGDYTITGYI